MPVQLYHNDQKQPGLYTSGAGGFNSLLLLPLPPPFYFPSLSIFLVLHFSVVPTFLPYLLHWVLFLL